MQQGRKTLFTKYGESSIPRLDTPTAFSRNCTLDEKNRGEGRRVSMHPQPSRAKVRKHTSSSYRSTEMGRAFLRRLTQIRAPWLSGLCAPPIGCLRRVYPPHLITSVGVSGPHGFRGPPQRQ